VRTVPTPAAREDILAQFRYYALDQGMRAWPVPGFEDIRLYYLETADVLLIVRVLHDKRDVQQILQGEPSRS